MLECYIDSEAKLRPAQLTLRGVAHFGHWVSEHGVPIEHVDDELIDTFARRLPTCALNILQATGDIRKVASWLGYESIQTTEDYLRVDVTQKIGTLDATTPPRL